VAVNFCSSTASFGSGVNLYFINAIRGRPPRFVTNLLSRSRNRSSSITKKLAAPDATANRQTACCYGRSKTLRCYASLSSRFRTQQRESVLGSAITQCATLRKRTLAGIAAFACTSERHQTGAPAVPAMRAAMFRRVSHQPGPRERLASSVACGHERVTLAAPKYSDLSRQGFRSQT
jgi:hypothetical protein